MAVKLSGKQIISTQELLALGDERLKDAQSLLRSKRFSAAVYLAGYAIECYLKAAICKTLDLDGLPELFKSHDLGELLVFSGLERQMKNEQKVFASFQVIAGLWVMEPREVKRGGQQIIEESVRYRSPGLFDEGTAVNFLQCVGASPEGVVPWLQTKI